MLCVALSCARLDTGFPSASEPVSPGANRVIRVTDRVIASGSKKIGMNLSAQASWSPEQFLTIHQHDNFEGGIQRSISFGPASGPGWVLDWSPAAEFDAEDLSIRVLTGPAAGSVARLTTITTGATEHKGESKDFTKYTFDADFDIGVNQAYVLEHTLTNGAVDVDAVMPGHYAFRGNPKTSYETDDISPNSGGKVALRIECDAESHRTVLHKIYSEVVNPAGKWRLSFRAKGLNDAARLICTVDTARADVELTPEWKDYELVLDEPPRDSFRSVVMSGIRVPENAALLLDDIVWIRPGGNNNPSIFLDHIVELLREFYADWRTSGILRYWIGQLGDTVENMVADRESRRGTTYSRWREVPPNYEHLSYDLHEFLVLCELLKVEPWICIPAATTEEEVGRLMEYLAGPADTVGGGWRAQRGRAAPWTDSLSPIHVELGNEAWNGTFGGGGIQLTHRLAEYADAVFAAAKHSPYYAPDVFTFHLGGQAVNLWSATGLVQSANTDAFTIGPYLMHNAHCEDASQLYMEAIALARHNLTTGFMNGWRELVPADAGRDLSVYEVNFHLTGRNAFTAEAKNSLVTGLGGAVCIADYCLGLMRDAEIRDLCFYNLAQRSFKDANGHQILLWGVLRKTLPDDILRRINFYALSLCNAAIRDQMLRVELTADFPTYDFQAEKIVVTNAPYIKSYAFRDDIGASVVLVNLHPSDSVGVTLDCRELFGSPVSAEIERLAGEAIDAGNETDLNVQPVTERVDAFQPVRRMNLPPHSITRIGIETK